MITKKSIDLKNIDYASGEVVLIDKEKGKSSFNIVYRVRKIVNVKKVGHAGTLDPAATGLLIVCVGKQTKEIYKYQDLDKTYSGTIKLGKNTPSMDAETEFIEERDYSFVTEEMVEETRKLFLGKIQQIPPMYSALKQNGKRLYKLARKGVEVERQPREVTIYDFEITRIELPEIDFRIRCSKGTYIRVIANDFGEKLNCGGYLKSLRREAIGEFNVNDSLSVDEFRTLNEV
ncbi:MAG: tRNA pseudouridine(55) synthase TruB [Bacteroidetes bacterium]|nr:tRNA pseudouridine(55) synthase TruB [Bacteroidota bacterium]MBU1117120.1 tRNA pseudouridine(55) synthase TruB [Bacteroidota bacterium]MBU1798651.1 tRNA pseudouridine(55) synthase TruB [Bacteroidota bacterium]